MYCLDNKYFIKLCLLHNKEITPWRLSVDIIDMLDKKGFFDAPDDSVSAEDYIKTHRVCDFYCKSGNLLRIVYLKFVKALLGKFKSVEELDYFIWRHLIYAIAPDYLTAELLRKQFYRNSKFDLSVELGHIYVRGKGKYVPKELEGMKFDVVIGNPPYNNDMYLDFVELGHKMAKDYSLWITPAKFVAKKELSSLYPYMVNFTFYPEAQEIFDIRNLDGIAYYLIGKTVQSTCLVCNKIKKVECFNTCDNIPFSSIKSCNLFTNTLVNKLGTYTSLGHRLNLLQSPFGVSKDVRGVSAKDDEHPYHLLAGKQGSNIDDRGWIESNKVTNSLGMVAKYKVCVNTMMGNCFYDKQGTTLGLNATFIYKPYEVTPHPYLCLMAFDTYEEAVNFDRFLNTRFIKFLLFTAICSQNNTTKLNWRFVPDLGTFDKFYEDRPLKGYEDKVDSNGEYTDKNGVVHCSLYKKYDLTDYEMDVIDSIIRER